MNTADLLARVTAALGPLAPRIVPHLAEHLEPRDDAIPCTDFLEPGHLSAVLAAYGQTWAGCDRRAVASDWTKAYFRALIPAVVVPALCGIGVDGGNGNTRLALDGARPSQLGFARLEDGVAVDVDAIYGRLLAGHVQPLAEAVRAVSGLSARVVWSNAGNLIAFLFREAGRLPALAPAAEAQAAAVTGRRAVPYLTGPNPLFEPVRMIPVAVSEGIVSVPRRRVCCLRDRLGESLCTSCPRLAPCASRQAGTG